MREGERGRGRERKHKFTVDGSERETAKEGTFYVVETIIYLIRPTSLYKLPYVNLRNGRQLVYKSKQCA